MLLRYEERERSLVWIVVSKASMGFSAGFAWSWTAEPHPQQDREFGPFDLKYRRMGL